MSLNHHNLNLRYQLGQLWPIRLTGNQLTTTSSLYKRVPKMRSCRTTARRSRSSSLPTKRKYRLVAKQERKQASFKNDIVNRFVYNLKDIIVLCTISYKEYLRALKEIDEQIIVIRYMLLNDSYEYWRGIRVWKMKMLYKQVK